MLSVVTQPQHFGCPSLPTGRLSTMEEGRGRRAVLCRAAHDAGPDIVNGFLDDDVRAMFGDEWAENAKNNLMSALVTGSAVSRAGALVPMANMTKPGPSVQSGFGHHHRSGKSLSKRAMPNPSKPNGSLRPPRNYALRGVDGVMHCLAVRRTRSTSQGSNNVFEQRPKRQPCLKLDSQFKATGTAKANDGRSLPSV
ncbi:hypothetical protein LZ31DRAFT_328133 [Colletotrichum somersetense]|nr:hypothetical protein LZ31DRAFT_328133 [Colletotrichum somersetense]